MRRKWCPSPSVRRLLCSTLFRQRRSVNAAACGIGHCAFWGSYVPDAEHKIERCVLRAFYAGKIFAFMDTYAGVRKAGASIDTALAAACGACDIALLPDSSVTRVPAADTLSTSIVEYCIPSVVLESVKGDALRTIYDDLAKAAPQFENGSSACRNQDGLVFRVRSVETRRDFDYILDRATQSIGNFYYTRRYGDGPAQVIGRVGL